MFVASREAPMMIERDSNFMYALPGEKDKYVTKRVVRKTRKMIFTQRKLYFHVLFFQVDVATPTLIY